MVDEHVDTWMMRDSPGKRNSKNGDTRMIAIAFAFDHVIDVVEQKHSRRSVESGTDCLLSLPLVRRQSLHGNVAAGRDGTGNFRQCRLSGLGVVGVNAVWTGELTIPGETIRLSETAS